uniref:Uncharacterized protein n=1 Tax=Acrobeloides nanus TaxID=290746 RepID=A0A914CQN5_9BILA
MNEARRRVTLHCTKTKQNFKLKLDPNGNLCLSCLKDFGIDAIGVRYKVTSSDEYMVIPAEPNGLIEEPEEGWDGLNLEIFHRLSDTQECYQSVDQIANMSYPTEEDKFIKEEPDLETFNIDQERDYNGISASSPYINYDCQNIEKFICFKITMWAHVKESLFGSKI